MPFTKPTKNSVQARRGSYKGYGVTSYVEGIPVKAFLGNIE